MRSITFLAALAALLLCACAAPTSKAPAGAPSLWRAGEQADLPPDSQWWRGFGSAELDRLIELARRENTDIAAATARMRQADAAARAAGAALLPALDGELSAGRRRQSGSGGATLSDSHYGAGLSAGYELDLWGRNRALRDSAGARAGAGVFERDALRLSIEAAVATGWLQWLSLRERATLAELNLGTARRLLELVEARAEAGAASPLELAQQRALAAAQQRELAALRQSEGSAYTALLILLGHEAGDSAATTEPSATMAQGVGDGAATIALAQLREPAIGAGLPSALLARRPDIARAEMLLRAADADIKAARAALWPSLTLSAGALAEGPQLRRLFNDPLYSLAAALGAPIFDGGRRAAERDQFEARREELLADYRATLLRAFGDVEDALTSVTGLSAQTEAQDEELSQARRALELAELRYRAGAETLLTLLDSQRTLYAAEDTSLQLRALRLQARVALCKALGGGWRAPQNG